MATLGYIWNQLKPEHLDMTVRIPLIKLFEFRRPILTPDYTFRGRPLKGTWKKEALASCLLFLPLTNESILPVVEAFLPLLWESNMG